MEKVWLKSYPQSVPHELPNLKKTLIEEFEDTCKEFKKKTAFVSFDKKLSYQELYEESSRLAVYLQNQGFKKNDVIVIQLPNLLQYPIALWGSLMAGLTVVNMNPLYTPKEMLIPIKETKAKGIFLLSNKLKELKEILDQSFLERVIVSNPGDLLDFPKKQLFNWFWKYKTKSFFSDNKALKTSSEDSPSKKNLYVSFGSALKSDRSRLSSVHRDKEDVLFIQYTGGTTGVIKGACLTQNNILSNLKQCEIWMTSHFKRGQETALTALPLYHIFSFLVNGLMFFCNGYTSVLIADPRQIDSMVSVLRKHKISVGTGLNTLFKALLQNKNFKKLDFSNWKTFISGGMALERAVQKEWESCTQSRLIEGYGLTESSPVVSVGRLDQASVGFVGYPLPSTEVRITDEEGRELGFDTAGELEVRGPQVMKGYYKNKEETQMVLNQEGWLKTGDIAKVNQKGLIQIIDRKKDMINISGFKVYPNELEQVLLSHPKVKDSVVIGEKDKNNVEGIKAFIVKKEESLNEKEVLRYCRSNLANYKIPKQICFCENLPKNFVGKPLRRSMRQSSN